MTLILEIDIEPSRFKLYLMLSKVPNETSKFNIVTN